MHMINFQNKEIGTDSDGYLIDFNDWHEDIVPILASKENIVLTLEHWEVIYLVRQFYLEFKVSPAMRLLVKAMEKTYGSKKGNSKYLFTLFREGPAKQATKLAGLPKPVKCL